MTSSSAPGQHKQSLLAQSVFLRLLLIAVALGRPPPPRITSFVNKRRPAPDRPARCSVIIAREAERETPTHSRMVQPADAAVAIARVHTFALQ